MSAEEQKSAGFIERHLYSLGKACEDLEAAIVLFNFSRENMATAKAPTPEEDRRWRILRDWSFIAAREAASVLYRFAESMEWLVINLNQCPTLLAKIDHAAKREATRKFAQYFPNYDGLRHSSQHTAKIYGTPERAAQHSPKDSHRSINNLWGHSYETDFEGKRVSLDITEETLTKLQEVKELYWAVFAPLDPMRQMVPPL